MHFFCSFKNAVYPILRRLGLLTTSSFVLAAIVEFKIVQSLPKLVDILCQMPQYLNETKSYRRYNKWTNCFLSIGLGFSYEQAPKTMKSVVTAFWQLTVDFGNLLALLFASSNSFNRQSHELLFFVGLSIIDILIFVGLSYCYKNLAQIVKKNWKKKQVWNSENKYKRKEV